MTSKEREIKDELAALRRAHQRVTASKEEAKKFLVQAGIITKTGKLAKPYR